MKTYDLVKNILEESMVYRESDKALIWEFWRREMNRDPLMPIISRSEYMTLTPPESITRARRMIQERHPDLGAAIRIKSLRQRKENTKGTFVFREDTGQGKFI